MLFLKRRKNNGAQLDPDEILADSVSALGEGGADARLEHPLERIGGFVFIFIIILGFGLLIWRAAWLGISNGESFFAKSQENRFLVRPIFAPRGVIYDRFGKPLAENIPSFGLIFEKDEFLREGGDLRELLSKLASLLNQSEDSLWELGFPRDYNVSALPRRIFLRQNLSLAEVVSLTLAVEKLPGVSIFEGYRRVYQDPVADSHALGFVGKVSESDLRERPELLGEELVGKSGIEAFYDSVLRGRRGKKIVEVDASGQESRFRLTEEPKNGRNIVLTLDGDLEHFAFAALDGFLGGKKGASVIITDPKSGEVLSLISYPGFDINKFGYNLSSKEFETVLQNPLKPLFNRAIAGEFPSGSTLKPLIGAAALEEKIVDPRKRIFDPGYLDIPHPYRPGEYSRFLDWKPHGWVDFYDAIAVSANVYFYIIGGGYGSEHGLGIERIKKYATAFGLGSRLGIDVPGERPGLFPDPEIKKILEPSDSIWRVGDTYNVSIGQGGVRVTPLQIAMLTSAISNGGTLWRPYLLKAVLDEEGNVVEEKAPNAIRTDFVSVESLRHVIKGMRQAVEAGTARMLSALPVSAAAKTGTAQTSSGLPHAWVTAFAPVEDPEIAITVMVEHAGEGSTVAMPITYEIMRWYFENRYNKKYAASDAAK